MSETSWFDTRWPARLARLGFIPEQMVRCRTNSDARLLIPARINGEAVQLVFAISSHSSLYQSYAEDRGLSVVAGPKNLRYAQLAELSAFGRTLTDARVTVEGQYRQGNPPIAGYLGSGFLGDGIVAVDASVPAMAFAASRENLSLDGAISRFPLDGNAVQLEAGTFLVSYQTTSEVALRFVGKNRPGRNGRADITLAFPGGVTITESIPVREITSKIAGILGADLLCRWITVFDFPARELLLFSYD